MRSVRELWVDIVVRPPVLFPLVGLFHVLWLIWTLVTLRGEPFGIPELVKVSWMVSYTFFWIGACDMRKWAALGYMFITILNFALFFLLKSTYDKDIYTSTLFLLDGLFSFFLLIYYKRFG